MIETYEDLVTSVGKWLKRPDLAALVPDFISLAESHLNKVLKVEQMRNYFTFTPLSPSITLPSDYTKLIRVYYNGIVIPFFPSEFESAYAGGEFSRIGYGYQIIGNTMSLSVPQMGGTLRLEYYATLDPLSPVDDSNWLLEDAPDVYLYAVLHEAAVYVRDDARMTLWLQKRDAAVQDLIDSDLDTRTPDQPLVMRRG